MEDRSFEFYKEHYGEPIFRALSDATFDERMFGDVPYESCVFKLNHCSKVMVVSRYGDKNEWHANYGERFVVSELLRRAQVDNGESAKCRACRERRSREEFEHR